MREARYPSPLVPVAAGRAATPAVFQVYSKMALAAAWACRHLGMTAQELLQDGIRRFVPFKVAAKGAELSADFPGRGTPLYGLTRLRGR